MSDQIRFSNGRISIGLNAANGAWVELVDKTTGANLIKNRRDVLGSPLSVLLKNANGYARLFDGTQAGFHPVIRVDGLKCEVIYPALQSEERETVPIQVQVNFQLDETEASVDIWASVRCSGNAKLDTIRFPMIKGVWLGQDWRKNVLVTPINGGEKIVNPVEVLSTEPPTIEWRWQGYRWPHRLGGPCGHKESDCWVRSAAMAGECAAAFADLYDEHGGVLMSLQDENHGMRALRIETGGRLSPGIGFGFEHPAQGQSWQSPVCTICLHEGCWREAVDLYRKDHYDTPQSPEWFIQSAGLVAHYDFQYQSGEIIHRFADLPQLYRHTQEQGLDNIMLAGWHEGGFDRGFPCYRANELLGGHKALKEAVQSIRAQGGHVTFYINSRLCNTAYPEFAALVKNAAVRTADGEPTLEKYGSDELVFACMSPQAKAWRETIVDAARYLVHEIGADGLYLDQLSAATPQRCYGDGQELDGWNRGCRQLLQEVRAAVGPEIMLLIQGVSQMTGPLCDGMLTGTLTYLYSGGFTAFYRYLQPDHVLADMMVPRRFSAMRPEAVAMLSSYVMDRAFVEGSFVWVYDLEGDNTFRLDPPQHERLRKMLLLRRAWLKHYGPGRYRDEEGIYAPRAMVRRFTLKNGNVLLACANEKQEAAEVIISLPWPASAAYRSMEAPETEKPLSCDFANGQLKLTLPQTALCVIHLFKESGECE